MPPPVNLRSSAVKRIMQEARDTGDPDTDGFVAAPLEVGLSRTRLIPVGHVRVALHAARRRRHRV